jgi:hypothetical protein
MNEEAMNDLQETVRMIKKIQREVRKDFGAAFTAPLEKKWSGADPVSGFDEKGTFSENNWNDARINLFRMFFSGWFHRGISDDIVFIGDLEVMHKWFEDYNYVFIRNIKTNDLYYATWYKSRGRTDLILHNGQKITLDAFKNLLTEMLKPLKLSPSFKFLASS